MEEGKNMGKCVICGKTTDNQYAYFSGQVASRTSGVTLVGIIKTTNYTDMQSHAEYLCTKCIIKTNPSKYFIAPVILLAMSILMLFTPPAHYTFIQMIPPSVFILIIAVLCLIPFFRYSRKCKNDDRQNDEKAAQILIAHAKNNAPELIYFSPSEYHKLDF